MDKSFSSLSFDDIPLCLLAFILVVTTLNCIIRIHIVNQEFKIRYAIDEFAINQASAL
jgi:hypothetical protein